MKRSIKIAGILFVALSFTTIISKAENTNPVNLIKQDKIIISGTIKDENGNPVENTEILFDTTAMAVTDKNGSFSFKPAAITPSSHNIYFSRDSFATVVRTYYPVMLSANYNVVLYRQINSNKTKYVSIEPVYAERKDTMQVVHNKILQLWPATDNYSSDTALLQIKTSSQHGNCCC